MAAKGTGLRLPAGDIHQMPLHRLGLDDRGKAAVVVAANATDATEMRLVLDMLGLDHADATQARTGLARARGCRR